MKILIGKDLKQAIISASNNLFNNKERIDALNVFPVPDGDTGSNMSLTIKKACENLEESKLNNINEIIAFVSRNMLLSARGNSGVILSQIFKGFSNAWTKNKELTPEQVVKGFEGATKTAYASVLKPIEGTILTVIRETSENLRKNFKDKMTIVDVFEKAIEYARKSLNNTPNLLPVLKEVGVVDSGGEGLLMILEGIHSSLINKPIEIDLNATRQLSFILDTEVYSGEFGYCTELIIKLSNVEKFSKDSFVKQAEKIGNSLVVVQDDDILKIHIHAVNPGKMLNLGQKFGEFLTVKVENMTEQANNTKSQADDSNQQKDIKKQKKKENAIISCNTGNGFIDLMKDYECDYIIEGGQSSNPSAKDIIEAIEAVNAKNIIILPNNSNIILAAQQAAKIKSNKNIYVIPTKSQVEGVTAILNYSSELDIEDNLHEINQGLKSLVVGEITQAVRDTKINNVKVKNGEFLMILKHKIINTKKDLYTATIGLIDKMMKTKKNPEVLVIYYGNNASLIDTKEIEKYVLKKYDVEVEIHNGGQNLYDYLIGLE